MKTKAYIIFFLFWGMIIGTTSGKNYQEKDGGIQVFLPKMTVELRFYTPNILRVTKYRRLYRLLLGCWLFSNKPRTLLFNYRNVICCCANNRWIKGLCKSEIR